MIGGLLDKITASLGKSFVFTGLLPAAVLLTVVECYRYGFAQFWDQLPTTAGDLKNITALGIAWLTVAFILFSIRTWIFDLFQRIPRGRFGPLLLRRWLGHRDKAEMTVSTLEWQYTVVQWPTSQFDPEAAIYRPRFIALPAIDDALRKSRLARTSLESMAERQEIYPGWWDCKSLLDGLCSLFAIVADQGNYQQNQVRLDAELLEWRGSINGDQQKLILDNLSRHVERELAVAFEENLQYAKGPWVYPTALGNRLAALDDYAQSRYFIPTVTIWDRLWWVLPAPARQEISDARLNVETLLNLSAVLLLCAIGIAAAALSALSSRLTPFLPEVTVGRVLLGVGAAIIAVACYRGTSFAVNALATKMMTLIDTNRLQLLAALGFAPKTIRDEIELFRELRLFFDQAHPRTSDREIKIPQSGDKDKSKKKNDASVGEDDDDNDDDDSG